MIRTMLAIVLCAFALTTNAQSRANITTDQVRADNKHGTSTQLQTSDGTGLVNHLATYAADGSLTDGGLLSAVGVTSFNGRSGAVAPASGDYSFSLISGIISSSQLPTISGLTPGSYTATNLTVDATGRITTASNGSSGSGSVTHTVGALTSGQLIIGNGAADIKTGNLTGDISTSGSTATTLAASGASAGTYTNPTMTVDAKGRVTSATSGSVGTTTNSPIQLYQSAAASSASTTFTIAFPSANTLGSAIVVSYAGTSAGSVSDSQGNTYTAYNVSGGFAQFVALNVKAGANTVTVTFSSGATAAAIYEYANVDSVDASTFGTASGTSVSTGSATALVPGDRVHMTGAYNSNAGWSPSNTAAWGALQSIAFGTSAGLTDYGTTQAAAGSTSNTLNTGGSSTIYAALLLLKPRVIAANPTATTGKVWTANGVGVPPSYQTPVFSSLTTTGTSGPASLAAGVLNIPNYAASGGGGNYILLESKTAISGTTTELDFASTFSSSYNVYVVEITGYVPATAGDALLIQFSTNGGTTWDTTSIYDWNSWVAIIASASGPAGNGQSSVNGLVTFSDSSRVGPPSTGSGMAATFKFYDPISSTNNKFVRGEGDSYYNGSGALYTFTMGGVYRNTSSVTAFRLKPNSTSGTFKAVVKTYGVS